MTHETNNPLENLLNLKKARDEWGNEISVNDSYLDNALAYYVARKWIDIDNRVAHDFVFKNVRSMMMEGYIGRNVSDDAVKNVIGAFVDAQKDISEFGL